MIRLTVEKKLKREDFEIMAPVGSWESLSAAIQGGADSVYFGAGALNMRSASSNQFSPDDLKEIARVCKDAGVKSYLTVNTIMYDDDLKLMRQYGKRSRYFSHYCLRRCGYELLQSNWNSRPSFNSAEHF